MKDLFGYEPQRPRLVEPGEIGSFRNDGPATMKAGAEAVSKSLGGLRGNVMRLYKEHRELTDGELVDLFAERFGEHEYRSISTRRRELVDKGLLVDSGRTKPNPKSRVANIIWRITPRGDEAVADPTPHRGAT